MAVAAPLPDLLEEATCSICLQYFQDPVLIPECGHNFCRGCLTGSWGTSESEASCPQCRQTFGPRNVLPNRQLARLVEVARRCEDPWGEEGGSVCPKHREPLKLFCKHHETLICVVCDRSQEHRGHWVIPAEEAFQKYQIKVGDCLKAQKEEKEKIATYKTDTEQRVQEMLDHIEKEKKNVVAEFRELQLWLEGQEELLLARMEETEKQIMAIKEKGLAKHTEDLCSLDYLIQEIEEKQQQPASKLLQDIGSILKKYQAKEIYENPVDLLVDPMWTIWDYSDLAVLLKRAIKKFRDTLESGLQLQEVNVILDRYTAHPGRLYIPEDGKSARHWQVYKWGKEYGTFSLSVRSGLVPTEEPTRIRISLNCEGGQVSFFDARTATLLRTLSDVSLVGETLLPSFCLYEGSSLSLA
ncbi:zinc finger protein RFP-like [Crotalus adamanteus]|uniref:Zinc finger protein RFP-like n=1 Tax=Crotalus adamanteus TaxID=8729 RepID=A0AAW1BUI2_CROAD